MSYLYVPKRFPAFSRIVSGLVMTLVGLNLYFSPAAVWWLVGFHADALFSPQQRDAFVRRVVPARQVLDVVNASYGPTARVGIVGQPIGAGLHGTAVYANWYNPEFIMQLRNAQQLEDIRTIIHRYQLTHFLVVNESAVSALTTLHDFLKTQTQVVTQNGSVVLYQIDGRASDGPRRERVLSRAERGSLGLRRKPTLDPCLV